jgi:hypothetical protein
MRRRAWWSGSKNRGQWSGISCQLQCGAVAGRMQARNRPAKQVRGTTLVEPTLNEQGSCSYIWLGVLSASSERLKSHGRVPPSKDGFTSASPHGPAGRFSLALRRLGVGFAEKVRASARLAMFSSAEQKQATQHAGILPLRQAQGQNDKS